MTSRTTTAAKPKARKPAKPKAVIDRKARFLEAYLADPERNATRAAIAAGYSEKTARQQASRLLTAVDIEPIVNRAEAESVAVVGRVIERSNLTKERALELLAIMASGDIRDVLSFGPEHRSLKLVDGSIVKTSGVGIRPSDEISDEAAMAIEEVSEGPNGIKVKMVSRRAAIMDFAKLAGWITEKREHEVPALTAFLQQVQQIAQRSPLPVGPRLPPATEGDLK